MNYNVKNIFVKILILGIIFFFSSCKVFNCISYNLSNHESNGEIFEKILNDTATCSLPKLEIVDNNFYSFLDSVLSWHYNCEYSEILIPNTYCFSIEYFKEQNEFNLLLSQYPIVNLVNPNLFGGFYYKNNLFVFSSSIEDLPDIDVVIRDTGCSLRIPFCNSWDVPSYFYFLRFKKVDNSYRITDCDICKEKAIV